MAHKEGVKPLTKSGFCAFPSEGSHEFCAYKQLNCDCTCHAAGTEED